MPTSRNRFFRTGLLGWRALGSLVALAVTLLAAVSAAASGPARDVPGLDVPGLDVPGPYVPGRYVEVSAKGQGRVRLHVEESGRGDPVVLLHGLGASTYEWRFIVPALARKHRVFNLDLKGFGRSDKPEDGRYSPIDQAALVKAFLLREGLTGVTLIGHSLGGGVALATTLDLNRSNPAAIKRLVLIDSAAYPQPLSGSVELLRDPIIGPVGLSILLPEFIAMLALTGDSSLSSATPQDIRAYARPLYDAGAKEALIATVQQIVPPNAAQLTRAYPTIQQPALLIWCRKDDVVPLAIGERLARNLPNAQLHVLEVCTHVPIEEEPRETSRLIVRFLNRH